MLLQAFFIFQNLKETWSDMATQKKKKGKKKYFRLDTGLRGLFCLDLVLKFDSCLNGSKKFLSFSKVLYILRRREKAMRVSS